MLQPKISLDIEIPEDVKELRLTNADEDTDLRADPDADLEWSADSQQTAVDHLLAFDHDLSSEADVPPVRLQIDS